MNIRVSTKVLKSIADTKLGLKMNPVIDFVIDKTGVRICSSGGDASILARVSTDVTSEEQISFSIQTVMIADVISKIKDEYLEIDYKNNRATIHSKDIKIELLTSQSDYIGYILDFDKSADWFVDFEKEKFSQLIGKVSDFVSRDSNNPAVRGILLEFSPGIVRSVSTDGKVMGYCEVKHDHNRTGSCIVPPDVAKKVSSESEKNILVYHNDTQIHFEYGDIKIIASQFEGKYPNYGRVIPKELKYSAEFSKKEIVRAFNVVSIIAYKNRSPRVDLYFNQEKLRISAVSQEYGNSETVVKTTNNTYNNIISYNLKFIDMIIKNMAEGSIKISMNDANGPTKITCSEDSYFYVAMPMRSEIETSPAEQDA